MNLRDRNNERDNRWNAHNGYGGSQKERDATEDLNEDHRPRHSLRGWHTGINAGWMDLGIGGTDHVAGTTSARDVFAAAQNAFKA